MRLEGWTAHGLIPRAGARAFEKSAAPVGTALGLGRRLIAAPASIERLDLHDRSSVIVADPERARALGVVDVDASDVGRVRQRILRVLAALVVEGGHAM